MENNEMSMDEWWKCLEEYCEGEDCSSWSEYEADVSGNPYGAGRYGEMRSSKDSKALVLGEEAGFDPDYNLWYEYSGCGYCCERDGIALQEQDAIELSLFHQEYPQMVCKESQFDLTYGDTRDDVSYIYFCLKEREGGMMRTFSFSLNDITMQEANEYIEAMKMWHRTGKFNIGPYNSIPKYDPWERSTW